MAFKIIDTGGSRSFPASHPIFAAAQEEGEGLVVVGVEAGARFRDLAAEATKAYRFALIELGTEYLGAYTGEAMGSEGGNALGFARFRLGRCEPTPLVELVVQPRTGADAIVGATQLLAQFDLSVSICRDAPGRIVDRLIRPFLNDALTRLDTGLGTVEEIDRALCLGMGYPKGPFALLEESGLAEHYEICSALHAMLGEPNVLPARRAQVAARKAGA